MQSNRVVIKVGNDEIGERYYNEDQELHREDGPAYHSYLTGTKAWYLYGEKHNEKGPAVIYGDCGAVQYWIKGKQISEEEFNKVRRQVAQKEAKRIKDARRRKQERADSHT